MKLLLVAAAAATLTAAPPALGQESGDDSRPVFTGPRIEGFGGVDFQDYDYQPGVPGAETHHTGGVAGALAGYDMEFMGFVVGAFGSYALPTSNFCAQLPPTSLGACVRPEREIEGGVRVGSRVGDRSLVYIKGAYVNTSIKVQSRGTSDIGPTFLNTHVLRDGWRAGAGAEYALTKHAYIKIEYDYTRTERFSLEPYGFPGTRYRQSKSQVLGGFGIRF